MKKKLSLPAISLLQSLGLVLYLGLVSTIFWKGNDWFGKMDNYLGPLMVLTLLVVSALVCALIAFGYPAILVWDKKQPKKAVKLVGLTLLWLALFFFGILVFLFLR